jgi:hypothetical protein
MKYLKLYLAVATILTLSSLHSHAQMVRSDLPISASDENAGSGSSVSGLVASAKAVNHFNKDYSLARDAQWSIFADKSMMCKFYLNNVLHRAFYTPHGNWIYTTSGYDGSKLNKAVARRIKTVYYDCRIVYADQVDLVIGKTFYIVEIQDENTIRKIRVNEDDMEVVQEFAKP